MRSSFVLALLLAGVATPALADSITIAQAHAVVAKEIELVSKNYVFPEKRAAIVAAIRANEKTGAYDLTNPAELAEKLGSDAIAASNDKHMWIQYDPAQYAALNAPQADPHAGAYEDRLANRSNHGYKDLRILPGNIRYANVASFNWESKTVPHAVTDAARFLGGGDAVIIDLRENGGGSGEAVRDLISYFMPAKKQVLMAYHDGASGKVDYSYVDLKLAAPRMVGKPLYVLTSGGTGSAAEEFAYHVKLFKLGTLIGDTTAGAANNDSVTPVAPGFVISTSTGRALHPVNNSNWEGTGVMPDVAVPANNALAKAQLMAMQALAAKPGTDKQELEIPMLIATAQVDAPPKLDAAALAAYAGTYGVRTVTASGDGLIFQRQGRSPKPMTHLTGDAFSIGDDTVIRFRRTDGKVSGFDMSTSDGQKIPVERTS